MEKIGRHVYAKLKSESNLSDDQIKQIEEFEVRRNIKRPELSKVEIEYLEKLKKIDKPKEYSLDANQLYIAFRKYYEIVNSKKFISTKDSKNNLAALCLYFSNDARFYSTPNLRDFSEPSFEKGLLVIGGFGNGKSSTIETFRQMFQSHPTYCFKSRSANKVVEDFESIESSDDKKDFWRDITSGRFHFGDVKTERVANNYGKVVLFKDIIEKRSEMGLKTFIDCNYNEGGNLESGLDEFGLKYGSKVYDRLAEMFNVIEFTGKSFRK